MDPTVVVGVLALVGVLIAQGLLHQRWAQEQDSKRRAEAVALEERQRELIAQAGRERRAEQAEMLDRMGQQTERVVEGALQIAQVHREDADSARQLAITNAAAHNECRQEVAHITGKVEELRARIVENERTTGIASLVSERHQDIKHRALGLLGVAQGFTSMVEQRIARCSCGAFDPLEHLTSGLNDSVLALITENAMPIEQWVRVHRTVNEGAPT